MNDADRKKLEELKKRALATVLTTDVNKYHLLHGDINYLFSTIVEQDRGIERLREDNDFLNGRVRQLTDFDSAVEREHLTKEIRWAQKRTHEAEAEVDYQRRHRKWALEKAKLHTEFERSERAFGDLMREGIEKAEAELLQVQKRSISAKSAWAEASDRADRAEADNRRLIEERDKLQERVKELEDALKREHSMRVDESGDSNETDCAVCRLLEAGDESA